MTVWIYCYMFTVLKSERDYLDITKEKDELKSEVWKAWCGHLYLHM